MDHIGIDVRQRSAFGAHGDRTDAARMLSGQLPADFAGEEDGLRGHVAPPDVHDQLSPAEMGMSTFGRQRNQFGDRQGSVSPQHGGAGDDSWACDPSVLRENRTRCTAGETAKTGRIRAHLAQGRATRAASGGRPLAWEATNSP